MTVKLLLLKSNDDVIADVHELSVEEKTVGYLLKKPYIVKIKTAEVLFENTTSNGNNVAVTFYPYMPLSDQKEIPIPSDWVVTIVEPINQVKEMYEEKINQQSQTSNFNESTDSTLTN
ncbi:hypothetical protein EBS02_00515 [bacterium]|nr:hypothetical protein [bacterium]